MACLLQPKRLLADPFKPAVLVKGKLVSFPQLFITAEAVVGLQKLANGFQRTRAKAILHRMTVDVGVLGNQVRSNSNKVLCTNSFI